MLTAENIKNLFVPILNQTLSAEQLVARLANIVASVAGVIAFFYLLYAGILYITSGNNPDQAKRAQIAIVNVIVGIIIIALSYIIIRLIGNFSVRIIQG
jgi:low affinity Fe/Cu permease